MLDEFRLFVDRWTFKNDTKGDCPFVWHAQVCFSQYCASCFESVFQSWMFMKVELCEILKLVKVSVSSSFQVTQKAAPYDPPITRITYLCCCWKNGIEKSKETSWIWKKKIELKHTSINNNWSKLLYKHHFRFFVQTVAAFHFRNRPTTMVQFYVCNKCTFDEWKFLIYVMF